MASKTKLVATIGPASASKDVLVKMIEHKMDMARLNFSWGTHEEHAALIANIRSAEEEADGEISIIQDLSGPRMKTETGHQLDETKASKAGASSVITEKDIADLEFGLSQGVDFVAISYVASAHDVTVLREMIRERMMLLKGKPAPFIIAKIERKIAVDNIKEIVKASDWIMVARGDLGNEYPLEEIPFIQHKIIAAAKKGGKPVIVATQMMLSMVDNPTPTRAEVSDVAHAIIEGADGTMLSEETARGKYPVEAVISMEKVISFAELHKKGSSTI